MLTIDICSSSRFPKVSKDIIKETLTIIAARQGQKEVDKKWVLL